MSMKRQELENRRLGRAQQSCGVCVESFGGHSVVPYWGIAECGEVIEVMGGASCISASQVWARDKDKDY
jgi:hypothetical protein